MSEVVDSMEQSAKQRISSSERTLVFLQLGGMASFKSPVILKGLLF